MRDAAILLVLVVLALSVRFDLPGEVVEGALTHAGTETSDTAVADTTEQEDVSVLDPPTAPAVLEFRLPGTSGAAGERVRCIVVDDHGQTRGARCSLLPADLAS